ncbi:MAG: PH domain-containing protein [Deltaproteobacteria bacterium]|nr:PH domain-containing protein [Deltaproteobacteria bacterium]
MTTGPPAALVVNGTVGYARVVLARNLMRAAYGVLLATFGALALASYDASGTVSLIIALTMFLASLGLAIASYVVWFVRGLRPGSVEVHAESLVVAARGGLRTIPRERIQSAATVYRPGADGQHVPHVEIDLEGGDRITVGAVAGEDEARALVAALGFGPGARRVRFDLGAPTRRLFHPLMLFAAYQIPSVILSIASAVTELYLLQVLAWPTAIVAYAYLRRRLRAPVVSVGEDGVLWEQGFKKRFIPRSEITALEQFHPAAPVTMHVRDGRPITLGGAGFDLPRCWAAGRAVRERLGSATAPLDRAAYFARDARSVAEWRAALSGKLEASYRAPTASVEDMSAVLTSPTATPEERVGAALALRVAGEPPVRIRVAAESVVSEPLREALVAAAEDDDAKLDRALQRMSRR